MEQKIEKNSYQDMENSKKTKYKIDYKKLGFLIGSIVLVAGLIFFGVWFFRSRGGEVKVYDAVVQLRDRVNKSDPEEDARSSAKKGDVILVRETGKEWSETEMASYLILKIKLNEDQVQKIVQPRTRELSKDEAKKKGVVNDEMLKGVRKEELEYMLTEDVLFREYRVEIEELDFDPMKVREAQPFPDKEFSWRIVEKKNK